MSTSNQEPTSPQKKKSRPKVPAAVQEALQLTWVLKGHLVRSQKLYLLVGRELARVRDEKLHAALKHPNMADYALQRLGLSERSLYRYLQVYDWVRVAHAEWLEPGYKGKIPDLAEMPEMIWLEKQLARKNLRPETRARMESAHQSGLAGKLDAKAVRAMRQSQHGSDLSLRALLAALRAVRKRASGLEGVPGEVVTNLDEAIEALRNGMDLKRVAMVIDGRGDRRSA